jgi:hypothetical protein
MQTKFKEKKNLAITFLYSVPELEANPKSHINLLEPEPQRDTYSSDSCGSELMFSGFKIATNSDSYLFLSWVGRFLIKKIISKWTVAQDFRPLVFFHQSTPPRALIWLRIR